MASFDVKKWIGTPWILLPAAGALAVVILDPELPVAAALLLIPLAIAWVPLRRHTQRRWAERAARVGLTYARKDPFDTLKAIPMPLFSRPNAPRVRDVLHGERQGRQVRVFHFSHGGEDRQEFTCAMIAVDADWPALSLGGLELDKDTLERAELSRVEMELGGFNRRFAVYARDPYMATAFVDQRLMDWLMGRSNAWGIECAGGWLLCHVNVDTISFADREPEYILALMDDVLQRVPRAAYSLFPKR